MILIRKALLFILFFCEFNSVDKKVVIISYLCDFNGSDKKNITIYGCFCYSNRFWRKSIDFFVFSYLKGFDKQQRCYLFLLLIIGKILDKTNPTRPD